MLIVSPEEARAAIARAVLGLPETRSRIVLGEIVLRPHQCDAVERLRVLLDRDRGALLADEVGLGKTYVALALARDAARPLIVAPAALREMWHDAMARAGVRAEWTSYERLSRGRKPEGQCDMVIADEAHHARNPATRRWSALSELTAHAHVLLLSATPVHNRGRDLPCLLSLFLGARAFELGAAALARFVVRRSRVDVADAALPRVSSLRWIHPPPESEIAERILALPAPLPPSDGGEGGALLALTLLRQWASSRGALRGALRRRLLQAGALGTALADGRHPTRAELATWIAGDELQLVLPGLDAPATGEARELLAAVRAHEVAVRDLLRELDELPDPDEDRARRIAELRERHRGERLIVFSQYADTVAALWRRLRATPRVAALGSRGGTTAGGPMSRAEVIARFAPVANGHPPPRAAERIDLLLTTDLLSEGVNLQDATVVLHADLPWTAARLEQRVGRVARPGAPTGVVTVYAFAPPADAESLIGLERRLHAKLAAAAGSIGISDEMLRGLALPGETSSRSPPELRERIRILLSRWSTGDVHATSGSTAETWVAAVHSVADGCLALLQTDGGPTLLASIDGPLSDEPADILPSLPLAEAAPAAVCRTRLAAALAAIAEWDERRRGRELSGLVAGAAVRTRRSLLARIDAIAGRTPAHVRPRLAPLIAAARECALAPFGIGAERELTSLAHADLPDDAWLRAVCAVAADHVEGHSLVPSRSGAASASPLPGPGPRVLILFAGPRGSG